MKHLTLLVLSAFLLLQSCGKDKKPRTKEGDTETTVSVSNNSNSQSTSSSKGLILTINADFNKNDELIVFWKDKSIGWFTDEKTIYGGSSNVKGHQTIEFKFPESAVPNDLRIDVSNDKDQKEIKINFIKISDEDREFYVFGDELTKYFKPNEFISYSETTHKLVLKSQGGKYDPALGTTHDFVLELQRVLNTTF